MTTRLAGLLYLVVISTTFFSQLIMLELIAFGDRAGTSSAIVESEGLYRLALAAELSSLAFYMGVMVILYFSFRTSSRSLSLLALSFGLVSTIVSILSVILRITPLIILTDPTRLDDHTIGQLQAMSGLFITLSYHAATIALVLFGLHSMFIGWLVRLSRIYSLPVGVVLMIGGLSHVLSSSLTVVRPEILARIPLGHLPGFGIGDTVVFLWAVWLAVIGIPLSKVQVTGESSSSIDAK